jgi:hypothetical protein
VNDGFVAECFSEKTQLGHLCGRKRAGTAAASKPLMPSSVIAISSRGSAALRGVILALVWIRIADEGSTDVSIHQAIRATGVPVAGPMAWRIEAANSENLNPE